MSNAVKESSDTSDDLSDTGLELESVVASLPNGILASGADCTKDVSEMIFEAVKPVSELPLSFLYCWCSLIFSNSVWICLPAVSLCLSTKSTSPGRLLGRFR